MERFSVDEVFLIRILPNLPQLQNLAKAGYFFFLHLEMNMIFNIFSKLQSNDIARHFHISSFGQGLIQL